MVIVLGVETCVCVGGGGGVQSCALSMLHLDCQVTLSQYMGDHNFKL